MLLSTRLNGNMIDYSNKATLYWLIEGYLAKRIPLLKFSQEYYACYYLELDHATLTSLETQHFSELYILIDYFLTSRSLLDNHNLEMFENNLRSKIREAKQSFFALAPAVTSIEWCCCNEEADVIISDGEFGIVCFSHPCTFSVGDKIIVPISPFSGDDVVRLSTPTLSIRPENIYNYKICGQIIDTEKALIKVGAFIFDLKSLPQDLQIGEFVMFSTGRLDV